MNRSLEAWIAAYRRHESLLSAARSAAEAVADDPWDVVEKAGVLARCRAVRAERDLGLTNRLRVVNVSSPRAVVRVPAGSWYPQPDRERCRALGAFDTPKEMARSLARRTLGASSRRVRAAVDPACGTGAFLLALAELGVPAVLGGDIDPVALAVAGVAVPSAQLRVADALDAGPEVDVVVTNPPFVSAERQGAELRARVRAAFPWLAGRFDLAVPIAAQAVERVRPDGAAGLLLPYSLACQPYASSLRRRWVERHGVCELLGPTRFPGVTVDVLEVVLSVDRLRPRVGPNGPTREAVLSLEQAPFDPLVRCGDAQWVQHVRARSVGVGDLCRVDTGVVCHGRLGGKDRLLSDAPGPGRVPYADARDFFRGRRRWLNYRPEEMHRPKDPALFAAPKLVVQRICAGGARVAIDRDGVFVGHTCTVVQPAGVELPVERLAEAIAEPAALGILRLERGQRLDLYPRDVAAVPIPHRWLEGDNASWADALELSACVLARLRALGTDATPPAGSDEVYVGA